MQQCLKQLFKTNRKFLFVYSVFFKVLSWDYILFSSSAAFYTVSFIPGSLPFPSQIASMIHISLSHPFLEIAVQPIFCSSASTLMFCFCFLLCLFPLSYCNLPLVSSSYLTQPDKISLWGTADSSQSPLACGEQWSYWSSEAGFTKTLEFRSKLDEGN